MSRIHYMSNIIVHESHFIVTVDSFILSKYHLNVYDRLEWGHWVPWERVF